MRLRRSGRVTVVVGREDPLTLLGDGLGCDPARLELLASRTGKPTLAAGPEFSVARSEEWAAVAISNGPAVGVDIEVVRPFDEIGALAQDLIPAQLRDPSLGVCTDPSEFYVAWCRLEAAVKACASTLDDAARCVGETVSAGFEPMPGMVVAAAVDIRDRVRFTWRWFGATAESNFPVGVR